MLISTLTIKERREQRKQAIDRFDWCMLGFLAGMATMFLIMAGMMGD